MCGRYTLAHSTRELLERFEAEYDGDEVNPSYNIAPTDTVPIIIAQPTEQGAVERKVCLVKWGLIPFWVKDLTKMKPLINARSESLIEKPSFKNAFKKKRCIIPADGFFEWKKEGSKKVPMRIRMKSGQLFGLAGIFDDWQAPDGSVIRTCSIITVAANQMMSSIHERMPVILPRQAESAWLNPSQTDVANLSRLLVPFEEDDLESYAVSTRVNSPAVKTKECIEAAAVL